MNSKLLKNACVNRWNRSGDPAADAQRQHHVAQLTDGRIGEHAFDIDGHDRDRGGDEQRDRADVRDHEQNFLREQRIAATDQKHAGRDHRGRMHQSRNGRGAFHRVGQPNLQRELRTFADAAAENAQAGDDQEAVG